MALCNFVSVFIMCLGLMGLDQARDGSKGNQLMPLKYIASPVICLMLSFVRLPFGLAGLNGMGR